MTHIDRANGSFCRDDKWAVSKYYFAKTTANARYGRTINNNLLETKEVSYAFNLSAYNNGTQRFFQVGKYTYLIFARAWTSGSYYTRHFTFNDEYPVKIFKYDLENDEIVQSWSLSPSTTGITAFTLGDNEYPTMFCNGKWAVFHKYIFDLSNLANVREITNFAGQDTGLTPISDDIAESESNRLDMGQAVVLPTNYASAGTYAAINYDNLLGYGGKYIFRDPRYIATINNLQEAVVKDASKTMKVSYIIRF